jgi:hypothetical protein
VAREEDVRQVGGPHRHAGVAAVGLLDGIRRQHPDGVDRLLLQLVVDRGHVRLQRKARNIAHGDGEIKGRSVTPLDATEAVA